MTCAKKCGCSTTKKGKEMTKEFNKIPPIPNPKPLSVKTKPKTAPPVLNVNTNKLLSTVYPKKVQVAQDRPMLSKADSFMTTYF